MNYDQWAFESLSAQITRLTDKVDTLIVRTAVLTHRVEVVEVARAKTPAKGESRAREGTLKAVAAMIVLATVFSSLPERQQSKILDHSVLLLLKRLE